MNLKTTIAISTGVLLAGISAAQTHSVSVLPSWSSNPNLLHSASHISDSGYIAGEIDFGNYVFIYRPSDGTIHVSPQLWPATPSDINNGGTLLFRRGAAGLGTLGSYTWSIGGSPFRIPEFTGQTNGNRIMGMAINDSGVVAGALATGDDAYGGIRVSQATDAFTWSLTQGHTLLPRDTNGQSMPVHIASNGVVRGLRIGSTFSWTPGSPALSLLAGPAVPDQVFRDMNGSGVAVGGTFNTAFRIAPGQSDIGANFLTTGLANAISEDGTAVGYTVINNAVRPCYWLPGSTTPIELPLPLLASTATAEGVNSRGEIVGRATINGFTKAVLWTPIPVSQTFTFSTRDGDGSAIRPNTPYQILDNSGNVAASGTTNGSGQASATLVLGSYTLVASLHGAFGVNSPLASTSAIAVTGSGVTGDLNLELGTLGAYFTMGGRIYRGAGTITIGGVSMALNRSRAGNWLTDGGNAKSFSATVTINGQTRLIPGTLIAGRDHTTLSFDWNNGS